MDTLLKYWTIILPLALLLIGFGIYSAIHVIKHPKYKFGNKLFWLLLVLLVQFFGPAIYFVFGRGDE